MDMTVVKSGHIPARERERLMRHTGHICISQSALFAAVFIHFVPGFSSSSSYSSPPVPPRLPALLPLSFPSMYIFRSRVIKSAPEGMCRNRISLILPCPHRTTKTQIHTNAGFTFFLFASYCCCCCCYVYILSIDMNFTSKIKPSGIRCQLKIFLHTYPL